MLEASFVFSKQLQGLVQCLCTV